MVLYLQDTVQKVAATGYLRLKQMVRLSAEQKVRDNDFNARNEDWSLQGAAAWKGNPNGYQQRPKHWRLHSVDLKKTSVREEIRAVSSTM